MAVQVTTSRLQHRLNQLARQLPSAVSSGLAASAQATINVMQNAARSDWAGGDQVGFDVEAWNRTIDRVEVLDAGGYGILNVQRMGTESDYEAIRGVPGAWHMGHRRGDAFGRFINSRPEAASEVADIRQSIWGDKQPQWFLLNDGNAFPGAFNPQSGTHTVERVAFDMVNDVRKIVSDRVNDRLRSLGVLI